jgi:lipopolysaccharide export system protein LptC
MTATTNPPEKAAKTADKSLSFIQPRDTKRTMKARRPPRVANFLRVALPGVALLFLIALVIWPVLRPNKIITAAMKNIPDLVVENLHYTGLDSKNQPYSVSAVKATRPKGLKNIYDLDKPEGEMTLTSGAWIAVKSQYGRYDQDTRKLWLGGNVQLFHDKGYQFTSDEAQVDLNDNYAWGEKPVLIQGGFGEIRGQGFKLLDNGHVMIVKGPAHALLSLHEGDGSDKPSATPSPTGKQ